MKLDKEMQLLAQDLGFTASGKIKKAPKLYGAFVQIKTESGKLVWQRRFDALAYSKKIAVQRFQNWLLAGVFGEREANEVKRELRPLK